MSETRYTPEEQKALGALAAQCISGEGMTALDAKAVLAIMVRMEADLKMARALPRQLRFARPSGVTMDDMRANVRTGPLYEIGDTILVWVNEGDFWLSGATEVPAPPPHPTA